MSQRMWRLCRSSIWMEYSATLSTNKPDCLELGLIPFLWAYARQCYLRDRLLECFANGNTGTAVCNKAFLFPSHGPIPLPPVTKLRVARTQRQRHLLVVLWWSLIVLIFFVLFSFVVFFTRTDPRRYNVELLIAENRRPNLGTKITKTALLLYF
jgi:hypothetical protein